jgi:integrase
VANIITRENGNRAVQFFDLKRVRRTVTLGRVTISQAKRAADRIESLVAAARMRAVLDLDTAKWLADIAGDMHAELVALGLCEARQSSEPEPVEPVVEQVVTLAGFVAEYLAMRKDVKPGTRYNLELARDNLLEFFGAERGLASITPLEADAYRMHLRSSLPDNSARRKTKREGKPGADDEHKTLAENTVRRMVSRARQFFTAAVRGRRIQENPFSHLKGLNVRAVKERQAFIDRQTTHKLLDAAPTAEWRAVIALARFGGIRVPSELYPLKWTDIDWDANVVHVVSPKTEHCGKGRRTVPLFPELRVVLRDAFEAAPDKSVYVLHRHRAESQNLRQGLERIIVKAGLTQWPKLFVNLRSSRATELVEHFPGHVAAEWLGHTEAVANEHYRQTTADHYKRAAAMPTGDVPSAASGAAVKSGNDRGERHGAGAVRRDDKKSPVIAGLSGLLPLSIQMSSYPARTRT